MSAQYVFDLSIGQITLGAEATHTLEYTSDDFKDLGGTVLAPGGDFNGLENISLNPFYPLPDWKGNAFLRYARDNWRFSYTVRYVTSFRDNSPPAFSNAANTLYNAVANADLRSIDSMMTQDVTLIYTWKDLTVVGLGIQPGRRRSAAGLRGAGVRSVYPQPARADVETATDVLARRQVIPTRSF